MRRRMVLLFPALGALVFLAPRVAMAQGEPPVRIRGTIAALDGASLTIIARDGQTVTVQLTEPLIVMTVKKADLSAIGPNTYIGTTTRTGADGTMSAIEVRIFPDSMRGSGEGSRPWDLGPGSTMTNGTVTGAVTGASGRQLTVGHKDGATTVFVPPSAGIMLYVPGERADLKPGAVVFTAAAKNADGVLTSGRLAVGKDGVVPLM